jgi:hypothetical protein
LAFNPLYEIEFAVHALYRDNRNAVMAATPHSAYGILPDGPSSFWIRRSGAPCGGMVASA